MSAFFAGVVFGIAVTVVASLLAAARFRKPREPDEWMEEQYQPPPVVKTRVLINKRTLEL